MLIACFVLISGVYVNAVSIVEINNGLFHKTIVEYGSGSTTRTISTKEPAKELVERINKECGKQ